MASGRGTGPRYWAAVPDKVLVCLGATLLALLILRRSSELVSCLSSFSLLATFVAVGWVVRVGLAPGLVATCASPDMLRAAIGGNRDSEAAVEGKRVGLVRIFRVAVILGFGFSMGCSEDASDLSGTGSRPSAPIEVPAPSAATSPTPEAAPVGRSPDELIADGRSVYNANCIACHSLDPTKDGTLGPAVSGASLALIEARVLRSEYPAGYEPKRPTKVMIALPHLESRLAELVAYLNSF